jgi:type III pantothenate kinase
MLSHIDADMISSVVTELNDTFREYFVARFGFQPLFLGAGIKTGIKVNSDNPKEVGADLIANAVSATVNYGKTVLVVDLGTATTFTYVENLTIRGVAIATGLTTSKNALISKTSLLPQIELEAPTKLLGTNSVDSIKSGIVFGHASMIDGMIRRIKKNLKNNELSVIMTGGHAKIVAPLCEEPLVVDDLLIIKGLLVIFGLNRERFGR